MGTQEERISKRQELLRSKDQNKKRSRKVGEAQSEEIMDAGAAVSAKILASNEKRLYELLKESFDES